jgi:hypothetical protein
VHGWVLKTMHDLAQLPPNQVWQMHTLQGRQTLVMQVLDSI